jgi:Mg-chelatase subunit ChlD
VPFAKIQVARTRGPLRLIAAADGVASLYPQFDGVASQALVTVNSAAGETSRAVNFSGARAVDVPLAGRSGPVNAMDVALVIDTTGSMGDEMAYLQAELDSIVARLKQDAGNLDLRIGVVLYRDEGDDYVVRSSPLTRDVASIRSMLAAQDADGGGDTPEAVDQAMAAAATLDWRPNAAKALVLVADAPPHDDRHNATLDATGALRSQGVQIVPIAASGVEATAQYMMRTMAALTQGRYIFLTDDSGVGNPHEEPDVACYVVTHLDQLIGRVLAGIAEGRRIEPGQGEIIRTVGSYDRGRCVATHTSAQS